ncbi:MAG: S8 family serine peptidase [Flavobacteriales bacterium]
MNKLVLSIVLIVLSASLAAQNAASVDGELLVQFEAGANPREVMDEVIAVCGILPELKLNRCVSEYMRIWLCTFDETEVSSNEMLRLLNHSKGISIAQVNHIIENRITPNDAFFGQQWHHVQAEDHDIDTDLAWDLTTGGLTAFNDEIVVCVVETGGATWDQADIVDNHWVNENEIPNNGIDDDNNGYTDDYDGWNITSSNDVISGGNHGTQVSSMIGAKGDNNLGIAGVNWDVKIMQVEMGGVSEANVIEAYEYPLIMRKLYNETGGDKGAFIVATNSSWGTDNGQPADAPLWCAMYDSLGTYGVLSCGATSNSSVNVDVVGDLPTACPSEFLITVGRTNSSDIRASGGYGLTTIDLMAPGDNVYLANNFNYALTTGTSFSSPCVAGAIALIYSIPCTTLMEIASAAPGEGASMVKQYILDEVDQTTQLIGETVSGGRLNVNNSLQAMLTDCEANGCIAPFSVDIIQQPGTLNYTISWSATASAENFSVRYKLSGEATWTTIENIETFEFVLNDLLPCEVYEVQLSTGCTGEESGWSPVILIETDGCCINPVTYEMTQQGTTEVTLTWNSVLAAASYTIEYSYPDGPVITIDNITGNTIVLTDLLPCTSYSANVISTCEGGNAETTTFNFNTAGCGACEDLSYCAISSNSSLEYVANVTVGNINHSSQDDGGYILVEGETTTFNAGGQYAISLTPGYAGSMYSEYFIVWIDYNANGVFEEPQEIAFDAGASTTTTISGTIFVPFTVADGIVRMRVGMSYMGNFGGGQPPVFCGENDYGETEDYCITLDSEVGVEEKMILTTSIYPNPAADNIVVQINQSSNQELFDVEIIAVSGQKVMAVQCRSGQVIDISSLAVGVYGMRIPSLSQGIIRFVKERQ